MVNNDIVNSEQLTAEIGATDVLTSEIIPIVVGYPRSYGDGRPPQVLSNAYQFTIAPACLADGTPATPCAATITPQNAHTLIYNATTNRSTTITIPAEAVTTTMTLAYTPVITPTDAA